MKLSDLSEAISITPMRNPLKREIHNEILDSTHQIYFKEPKLDPKVKEEINRGGSLSVIGPTVKGWLKEQLTVRVASGIEDIIKAHLDVDSQVKFEDIKTSGYASNIDIGLSNAYVNNIANEIWNQLYEVTMDNVQNENEKVETMFQCYKDADIRDLYGKSSKLEKLINDLVLTTIHEITHIAQNSAQFKSGRVNKEYRSYFEPNKEKFYASIGRLNKGEGTEEDYRLYRGSPQEVAAFAQETALNFINDMFLDQDISPEEVIEFRNEIPKLLNHYVNKQFNDPSNPMEYAVFKRFNKLMYQEVIRYVDELEKRLRRQKRKQKVNAG